MLVSNKCDITQSIEHLRSLRDELCKKEKDWKKAYEVRDYLESQLKELYKLLKVEKNSEKSLKKLRSIFETLDVDVETDTNE